MPLYVRYCIAHVVGFVTLANCLPPFVVRMYSRLQTVEEGQPQNEELKRLHGNIAECIQMFEELHVQRFEQSLRTFSVSTAQDVSDDTDIDRSFSV